MNRASPIDLRKALEMVNAMVKAGILFVPMPVLSEADHANLVAKAADRLEQIAEEAEAGQA
jgi:hypothetical protein